LQCQDILHPHQQLYLQLNQDIHLVPEVQKLADVGIEIEKICRSEKTRKYCNC